MSTAQLNLYLDLKEGHLVDLEVAAKAALALSDLIKEIHFAIDPFENVSVLLVDGSKGSLSLNTIIKSAKDDPDTRRKIKVAALVTAGWLGGHIIEKTWDKLADYAIESVTGPNETKLSDDDKEDIAKRSAKYSAEKLGQAQAQRLYDEIDRDQSITGVGIADKPGSRPRVIVPKWEFPFYTGAIFVENPETEKRTRYETRKVVLVSPVLLAGKRKWRFKTKEGEFGAPIQDEPFMRKLLSGRIGVPMKSDVEMTVEMKIIDEFKDGVWVPIDRTIIRVIGVPQAPSSRQTSLPFGEK